MSVDESGIGDRDGRVAKRFKIHGILRDALRTPSVGVIERDPAKGLVKYAKPAGRDRLDRADDESRADPSGHGDLRHQGPRRGRSSLRTRAPSERPPRSSASCAEVMEREGAPADVFQCVEQPSIPLSQRLMAECDLTLATGGAAMVKAAYSSGKPAFGVGGGNSTMVIDETADVVEAARNTHLSKTSDYGSGCSADGNLLIDDRIYDAMLDQLQAEGGYLAAADEKALLERAMWDSEGTRILATVAQPAVKLAAAAGISIPDDRTFVIVEQDEIGREHRFSGEKLTTLLAVFRYHGFDDALDKVRRSTRSPARATRAASSPSTTEHIDALARVAPVSRMMVRQPQSKANAGSFTNGMPMTSSLGCGIWGGNITNQNISLEHYLNVTWVSTPIPEDRPSEQDLFGEFYGTAAP